MANLTKLFLLTFIFLVSFISVSAQLVYITPNNPSTTQDLRCVLGANGQEYPANSYIWTLNGNQISNRGQVISNVQTVKNQVWTCQPQVQGSMGVYGMGSYTVQIANTAPTINTIPNHSRPNSTTTMRQVTIVPVTFIQVTTALVYNYQVTADDIDLYDVSSTEQLTYSVSGASGMTVSNSGLITWQNPTPGIYTILVTVTDTNRASASTSYTLTITGTVTPLSVTVNAIPNPVIVNSSVILTATTTGGSGNYTYAWSFGDTTSILINPATHAYARTGVFTATVLVTDIITSQTATASIPVTVTNSTSTPTTISVNMTINPATQVANQSVTFTANAAGGTNYDYSWTFDDGSTATTQTVNHAFAAPRVHTIIVQATDFVTGATAIATGTISITAPVIIPPTPTAPSFTTNLCPNATVDYSYTCDIDATGNVQFSLVSKPTGMTINSNTGLVSWTPNNEGTFTFTVNATDLTYSLSTLRTFTVHVDEEASSSSSSSTTSSVNENDLSVSIKLSQDTVNQGNSFSATVSIENEGNDDFKNMVVTMSIPELDVTTSTSKFKLSNDVSKTLTLTLPSKVQEGEYFVRFSVKNDDVNIVKYRPIVIKGTTGTVSAASNNQIDVNVKPTSLASGSSAKSSSPKTNWVGIVAVILLLGVLIAVARNLINQLNKNNQSDIRITELDNSL